MQSHVPALYYYDQAGAATGHSSLQRDLHVPASHTLVRIYSNSFGNTMYPTPSKPT